LSGKSIDEIVEALCDTDNDLVVDDLLYYHQDDLFSVYAITDASGAVVERYDYSDYGEVTVQRPDGSVKPDAYRLGNRHTYTGRLVERDTGLLQYRHRYMSPTLGRFVQRDPLGVWADSNAAGNAYAYGSSAPSRLVDPSGLIPYKEWIVPYFQRPGLFRPDDYEFNPSHYPDIWDAITSSQELQSLIDKLLSAIEDECSRLMEGISCDGPRTASSNGTKREPYDLTNNTELFPMGNGFLFLDYSCFANVGPCAKHIGCDTRPRVELKNCSCELSLRIDDMFQDPLDNGLEPGWPYPIRWNGPDVPFGERDLEWIL